jgi:ABC-2 type transport system permease protein
MITLSIYPADMFQGLIRLILFTILPAGFVTMVPVNLLNDFDLKWFLLLIFATVIWICISFISFNSGLRKYESGNLMVQKM